MAGLSTNSFIGKPQSVLVLVVAVACAGIVGISMRKEHARHNLYSSTGKCCGPLNQI